MVQQGNGPQLRRPLREMRSRPTPEQPAPWRICGAIVTDVESIFCSKRNIRLRGRSSCVLIRVGSESRGGSHRTEELGRTRSSGQHVRPSEEHPRLSLNQGDSSSNTMSEDEIEIRATIVGRTTLPRDPPHYRDFHSARNCSGPSSAPRPARTSIGSHLSKVSRYRPAATTVVASTPVRAAHQGHRSTRQAEVPRAPRRPAAACSEHSQMRRQG
jgi:hypothetical protein